MKLTFRVHDEGLKSELESSYAASRRINGEPDVTALRDVVLDPDTGLFHRGVLMPDSMPLATSGDLFERMRRRFASTMTRVRARKELRDGPYFYLGVFTSCWGHCLLDGTRFLWPIALGVRGVLPAGVRFVYSIAPLELKRCGSSDMLPNFRELLECAGVDPSRMVRISEPTAFDELLVADEVFKRTDDVWRSHVFLPAAVEMFERLSEAAAPNALPPFRKVYLSRSKWRKNALDIGEARIGEAFSRDVGFEVVSPEGLSFREMVQLLRETKVLASTEGSLAHNAVFLPRGAELVLLEKINHVNQYQPMVNEMRDLDVTYIEANRTDHVVHRDLAWRGPFFMCITPSLAEFLGCRPETPFWPRIHFLWVVFRRWLYLKVRRR